MTDGQKPAQGHDQQLRFVARPHLVAVVDRSVGRSE